MSVIKVGLPKGSLQESTFALMRRAGWACSVGSRSYVPTVDDPDLALRLVRPQEIPRYVELGLLDAGLTGYDWIYENGSDVEEVAELCYSKATSNPVRWVLAVPQDSAIQSVQDLEGKRIATEAVGLTKRYLAEKGVKAEVEFSWGATEVKAPELVDAIVELTETGSSLRANHLRIVETILTSTTRLIANKAAWADPAKHAKIEQMSVLLRAALAAEHKVLLKMNARKGDIPAVTRVLPSLHAPTINTLNDISWVAIETVVDESQVRDLIPRLCEAGASGIIELALNKVVP
ncbi:MAG: ATP phosphoribosyltransferase [Kiritimatiellae bacterium]|nr:ATP phosphoribosyltransferase [Kiritimatiellia bacterium]MBQ9345671.1 ATP phosphoribosyltransferase [Kiritimatiellia bacterium]